MAYYKRFQTASCYQVIWQKYILNTDISFHTDVIKGMLYIKPFPWWLNDFEVSFHQDNPFSINTENGSPSSNNINISYSSHSLHSLLIKFADLLKILKLQISCSGMEVMVSK